MGEGSAPATDEPPLPLARREDFRLGLATVRPSLRRVEGPAGAARAEPRVMQVLVALADAHGHVLTREDLLRLCWNGRIVGDDAINRAVAEVRRIADAVGGGFAVDTVARVGYRLTSVTPEPDDAAAQRAEGAVPSSRRGFVIAGLAGLAVAVAGGGAVLHSWRGRQVDALIERGRRLQASGDAEGLARAEAVSGRRSRGIRSGPPGGAGWRA